MRPLEPWRFLLLVAVIIAAIPCGIAAASPIWNGADLAVLICLAAFVGVLRIPGRTNTMTVKLSGSLPQEHDRNGMERLHAQLVKHPERRHVVVMVIDCVRTTVEHGGDGDRFTPAAGALFVEPITDGDDVDMILDVMGRVRAERTDDATLDFDFGVGTDRMAKAAFDLRTASGVFVSKDEEDAS